MDKLSVHSYIKNRSLLDLAATEIHDELVTAYGPYVVSYCTAARWIRRFSSGRESFYDDHRVGRPITMVTQRNIDERSSAKICRIQPHHDNARSHVSGIVLDYLREVKLNVMAHPPYSPDLAPSDFWLFTRLKRNLGTYPDARSLARGITMELNSIPIEEYQKTCHKWIERMKLCVEHQGNYLEHLM
ncbi:unnamed protein product [Adineta ricciae]|uniref:Mos1 transposase HTH domain-containing protein n=1 Tax=Adineta ricciae TaxID=249248 RepID=A0A814Z2Z8_ADIRI|nr:unnamed protein product [Adineta ricciae]